MAANLPRRDHFEAPNWIPIFHSTNVRLDLLTRKPKSFKFHLGVLILIGRTGVFSISSTWLWGLHLHLCRKPPRI
ncbi:hypothetical protein PRUPE_7G037200 [Prunus persica]|uniref:Uncharacterized protein n=1 Tax=Prunus persica TaxID=3760 RepID=A0A251N6C9_PRUPE|nr:hypothetical protein PRUPE_7G037200 [Prunus persica]ONH94882.1 hypothetical protein PRUPE_7G037200 [Prunus persica]ONH94883.1 hypothetical protein PRUPE_7G037200 [Prunus persica]